MSLLVTVAPCREKVNEFGQAPMSEELKRWARPKLKKLTGNDGKFRIDKFPLHLCSSFSFLRRFF